MKTVKIIELTGAALDWAVAKCEGDRVLSMDYFTPNHDLGRMNYSTDWAQGGPIIERAVIEINRGGAYQHNFWCASVGHGNKRLYGPTPLIAAMRCYVASKLGDTVEVPEELTQ